MGYAEQEAAMPSLVAENKDLKAKLAEAERAVVRAAGQILAHGCAISRESTRAEKAEAKLAEVHRALTPHPSPGGDVAWLAARVVENYGLLQKECDEARSELVEADARVERWKSSREAFRDRAEKAEAEAAALREALESIAQILGEDGYVEYDNLDFWTKKGLSQPGPGAALLERVRKLEVLHEAAHRVFGPNPDVHDAGEIRKALAALGAPCG